jgi:hypothetical protein
MLWNFQVSRLVRLEEALWASEVVRIRECLHLSLAVLLQDVRLLLLLDQLLQDARLLLLLGLQRQ